MLQYQVIGVIVILVVLLILMMCAIVELHSRRIANIMMTVATSDEPKMTMINSEEKEGNTIDSDIIPEIHITNDEPIIEALNEINTTIKLNYDSNTNSLTLDSGAVFRFIILMFVLKLQKENNQGFIRSMLYWVVSRLMKVGATSKENK